MIKTWRARCEQHPDHQTGMVTHAMIQARMQEEIDELRDDLAAARADAESWYQQSRDRIDDALKFAKERDAARAERDEARATVDALRVEMQMLIDAQAQDRAEIDAMARERDEARNELRVARETIERAHEIHAVMGEGWTRDVEERDALAEALRSMLDLRERTMRSELTERPELEIVAAARAAHVQREGT